MNSSQTKRTAVSNERESIAADPFAADIFADPKAKEIVRADSPPDEKTIEKPAWVWRLPKTDRSIDWTTLQNNLPADFSGALPNELAKALAKLLDRADENLTEFLFFTQRETSEKPEETGKSWWATGGIEASDAQFAVEIDAQFAVWLIDAMLGETVSDAVKTRDLTLSEIAVLEFLAVNLAHNANEIVSAPAFKFQSLSRNAPAWTAPTTNSEETFSMLVSTWQTIHGFQQSIVKLYVTPETLRALQPTENPLLTAKPRRNAMRRQFENRVGSARVRLSLGETQITLAEVAGLETGDVILIENYDFSVNRTGLYGNADIFLGDDERVKITGTFQPSEIELTEETIVEQEKSLVRPVNSAPALQFSVLYFEELANQMISEKSMSEEPANLTGEAVEETDGDDAATEGIRLENLAVTLRVELEARRLTLAEVGDLRINQIIELGARATDPVNLIIDNKTVARGELVEVENRLGVRIIQILR